MGNERVESAVLDAGPLIYLHEVGSLSLLTAWRFAIEVTFVWARAQVVLCANLTVNTD